MTNSGDQNKHTQCPTKIWNFKDAPAHLKVYSPHGGDEDFVILSIFEEEDYAFFKILNRLTVCDYSKHVIHEKDEQWFLYITAHS